MPEKATLQRVRRDQREGKAPSTQAGEFIREEIHHIREGKHGARSAGRRGPRAFAWLGTLSRRKGLSRR